MIVPVVLANFHNPGPESALGFRPGPDAPGPGPGPGPDAAVSWLPGERGGQRGGGGYGRGGDRTLHQPEPRGVCGGPALPGSDPRGHHQHAAVHRPSGRPLQPMTAAGF